MEKKKNNGLDFTTMNEMEGKMFLSVSSIPTIPQPSRWKNPQWTSIVICRLRQDLPGRTVTAHGVRESVR